MNRRSLLAAAGTATGLFALSSASVLADDKKPAKPIDAMTGRRVKVFLRGGRNFVGTVKQIARTQIYLINATPNPLEPATDVLIDTSSGGFDYIQILPKEDG